MKTIIAGSRTIWSFKTVEDAIKASGFDITEVVSGGAKGVDELGEKWAARNGVPSILFVADWESFGRSAGPIRNEEMARYANALIAVWDGVSAGTKHMIKEARKRRLKVYVHKV